jgi:hypothetical protein
VKLFLSAVISVQRTKRRKRREIAPDVGLKFKEKLAKRTLNVRRATLRNYSLMIANKSIENMAKFKYL